MEIAKVLGVAVSTVKDHRLDGSKLLLVNAADQTGKVVGKPYIALDLVGAGEGELVMVVRGSPARLAAGAADRPVDAAIVGILDSLAQDRTVTYSKS